MAKYTVIESRKFKTNILSVQFVYPLQEMSVTKLAVLMNILTDRTEKYHSKQLLSDKLDDLYGASVGSKVSAYGKSQVMEVRISFLNDAYTEEAIINEALQLLAEILFRPLLNEETVREAKDLHYAFLRRSLDNPSSFTQQQALKLAGANHPLGISVNGNAEDVAEISVVDIEEAYRLLLEESQIFVNMIGSLRAEEIIPLLEVVLPLKGRDDNEGTYYSFMPLESNEYVEYKAIGQSYLALIYNHDIGPLDAAYWKLRVTNALLGQLPVSLLFQEIREKRSLSYSISSMPIVYDEVIYIAAGIQIGSEDEVVELSKKQVQRLQDGDFDPELLEVVKVMLQNAFRSSLDYPQTMLNLLFQNSLFKRRQTVDDILDAIAKVSKEDVILTAGHLKLNTVFVLKGESNAENKQQ